MGRYYCLNISLIGLKLRIFIIECANYLHAPGISFCNRLLIIQGIILGHGKTKKVVWTLAVTGILGKNLQKKLIVSLLIGFEPVASCIAVLIANHYTISQVYRKFVKIESYFYIWYIFGKKFLLRQELRQPFLDSP